MLKALTRVVLLGLLCCAVVVGSPAVSEAATTSYGPAAPFTFELNNSTYDTALGYHIDCQNSAHWQSDGAVMQVVMGYSCQVGSMIQSTDLTVTFSSSTSSCSGSVYDVDLHDGWTSSGPTTGTLIANMGAPGNCVVDTVCLSGKVAESYGQDPTGDLGCQTVGIGGPAPLKSPPASCDAGTVSAPYVHPMYVNGGYQYQDVDFPAAPTPPSGAHWDGYVILTNAGSTATDGNAEPVAVGSYAAGTVKVAFVSSLTPGTAVTHSFRESYYGGSPIIGSGVILIGATWADKPQAWLDASLADVLISGLGTADSPPKNGVGVTDTNHCAFYWGSQVSPWAGPSYGSGTPLGALNDGTGNTDGGSATDPGTATTAPAQQTGCGFSITDPSTYASAGICELVGFVQELIDAVNNVATAVGHVLDGLISLLQACFVPDQAKLTADIDGVQQSWSTNTLGNYLAPVSNMLPASIDGGDCHGPTVTIPLEGKTYSDQPLDACSGAMSDLATASRGFLSATFVVCGAFACIRILGRAFGWDPGVSGADT